MNLLRRNIRTIALTLALAALGVLGAVLLIPTEQAAVARQLLGFPDSDVPSHTLRPLILGGLFALPALACIAYAMGGTFDRYITRQFVGVFGICISALFMIWLLMDLSDKISDFRGTLHPFTTIGVFYLTRLPAVLLLLLPYSLLLALLYSLGKLSSSREIIAIIQSGRGVIRITLPLVVAGLFCTVLALGLNYHWAPIAEGRQDEILAEASGNPATDATQVLYRNIESRRLWRIGAFPRGYEKGEPLADVEVTTTTADFQIESRLSATHAHWDRDTRAWTFLNPSISRHLPGREPEFERPTAPLIENSWPETPWQLIKPGLSAEYLGIPDLNTWLSSNARLRSFADPSPYLTQWHYRWALPFTCLVTVLLATPLAIHFSRRGPGGGIFLAVVLSAIMMLFSTIVLAFGEAGALPPAIAAWTPNLAFGLLAIYLFHRRISGRPIYHTLRKFVPGCPS
jgi:LPS export ABC transporter permease LptG